MVIIWSGQMSTETDDPIPQLYTAALFYSIGPIETIIEPKALTAQRPFSLPIESFG